MSLRDALKSLSAGAPRALPIMSDVERLVRAWPAIDGLVQETNALDLDAVAQRVIGALDAGNTPEPADWRYAAWCLWKPTPSLALHDRAFSRLIEEVSRMEQRKPYRRLASTYLLDYAPELPRIDVVARTLAACAERAGDPWHALQRDFGLFEGEVGVRRVAEAALDRNMTVPALLATSRLGTIGSEAGFAEAAFLAGLHRLGQGSGVSTGTHLARIHRWSLNESQNFIYAAHRAAVANALIRPFADSRPDGRETLSRFLIDRLGDPRTRPGAWIGAEEAARVVRRWLTEYSLRAFFDIIDSGVGDRTWRFRRSFWMGVFDEGLINEAWVIFGRGHIRNAQAYLGKGNFGQFSSGGSKQLDDHHAVLLMQVGNGVIADWSHNGRCNIWRDVGARDAPQLFRMSYTTDDVRRDTSRIRTEAQLNTMDVFTHNGSENFVWQNRVAARLQAMTGRRVPVR
ncbi:EH signature domain-containing protein [Microvirga sp. TS319]|uniref:EH signature domain-containing protein n=1 Tax=Microvirga sp. TS319 TaxID=3241165 RepID=UPI00351A2222